MIYKQAQSNRFTFLGVSKTGDAHINSGRQNQDAIEFFALEDSFVVAVSDGLGSCERSQIGSRTAVLICSQILLEIEDERLEFECESVVQRFTELWTAAFSQSISKKYSATIKAVFAKGNKLIAISIGDGLLCILSGEETIFAPITEGDFINETVCLSHRMKPDVLWTGSITRENGTVIFLSTDGVASGISEGRELELVLEIGATKDISELKHGIENMLTEMEKYNSDDKTVGVVIL